MPYLRPDGKTQISIVYDEEHRPIAVDNVVISAQHHPDVDQATIARDLDKHVIEAVIPPAAADQRYKGADQPHRALCGGGPQGRCGPHGPEDYRGYLRGLRPPRRRSVLG